MARRKLQVTAGPAAPAIDEDIGVFAEQAMRTYGVAVNEDRSIPSFEDGLKPVSRRLLWAAVSTAATQTKAARVIGECIGRYSPHGDAAAYGALVTLVNGPTPVFTGVGNWGTLLDPPAAHRYTNVLLSTYGHTFLRKEYLAVAPMCPNFDETCKEPIVLPALLPNILLNDTRGIGVGVVTRLPAFEPASVLKVLISVLDGEKPTPEAVAKTLKLYEPWGGKPQKTKKNFEQLLALMTNPSATILYSSPLTIEREKKSLRIDKFAPDLDLEKAQTQIRALSAVKSVHSGSGLSFEVKAHSNVNFNEFDAMCKRIESIVTTSARYSIYVSERRPTGDGKFEVSFHKLGILQLLSKWLRWRIDLEVQSLTWRAAQVQARIAYLSLLLHAANPNHLKIIFDALQKPDTAKRIAAGLKISLEDAETILNLKVRSLSKLDTDELRRERADAEAKAKVLAKQIKHPKPVVREYFAHAMRLFREAPRDPKQSNHLQWWLSKS